MIESRETVKRLFVLDDQPVVIRGIEAMAADHGGLMLCGSASNIHDALAALHKVKADLFVCDLLIQGCDVLQAIQRGTNGTPLPPWAVYTSHDETVFAERAIRMGAKAYVLKHEPLEKAAKAFMEAAFGRISVTPSLSRGFEAARVNGSADPLNTLSPKEKHILMLISQGYRRKEIAESLSISAKTVDTHTNRIKSKLHIRESAKLHRFAASHRRMFGVT